MATGCHGFEGVWLCFEWLGVKGNEKFGLWTGNYTEERETRVRRLAVATQKRERERENGGESNFGISVNI